MFANGQKDLRTPEPAFGSQPHNVSSFLAKCSEYEKLITCRYIAGQITTVMSKVNSQNYCFDNEELIQDVLDSNQRIILCHMINLS